MCSTEEDNAVKLRIFNSGKLYHQYSEVILSVWLRIFNTGESHYEYVQYAVKSNLSTAESHFQYDYRYAVWDELLEKRGTIEFAVTSIKNNQEPVVGCKN